MACRGMPPAAFDIARHCASNMGLSSSLWDTIEYRFLRDVAGRETSSVEHENDIEYQGIINSDRNIDDNCTTTSQSSILFLLWYLKAPSWI